MAIQVKVSGDPRRPQEAKKYVRAAKEEPELDAMLIVALVCGLISMFWKVKLGAWGAVLASLSSFACAKSVDFDSKQMTTIFSFALFSIFACYQVPRKQ